MGISKYIARDTSHAYGRESDISRACDVEDLGHNETYTNDCIKPLWYTSREIAFDLGVLVEAHPKYEADIKAAQSEHFGCFRPKWKHVSADACL